MKRNTLASLPPPVHGGGPPNMPNAASRATRYYPAGATEVQDLTVVQQRLKIARHSPCSHGEAYVGADMHDGGRNASRKVGSQDGCSCTGYRPPSQTRLKSLSVKAAGAAFVDEAQWGWDACRCGHPLESHGLHRKEDDEEEFTRRAKVALRMDELLEVRASSKHHEPHSDRAAFHRISNSC